MRDFIKDIFTQHRAERNGSFLILLGIAIVLSVGVYHQKFSSPKVYEHDTFKTEIAAFLSSKRETGYSLKEERETAKQKKRKEISYFNFNPNNLSKEKWMLLGFSEKQASVIKNYESKSEGFRIKSDLKNLFVISEEKYLELEPWIDLPNIEDKSDSELEITDKPLKRETKNEISIPLELNSCDTSSLKRLKGIGSYYAIKIIEYRNELGGYHSTEQLMEIWKMREETIESILPYIEIDEQSIKKINLNVATSEDLKSHPYLDWSQANSIVNMRLQNGDYKSIEDIKKSILIDDLHFEKIKPYITINDREED